MAGASSGMAIAFACHIHAYTARAPRWKLVSCCVHRERLFRAFFAEALARAVYHLTLAARERAQGLGMRTRENVGNKTNVWDETFVRVREVLIAAC